MRGTIPSGSTAVPGLAAKPVRDIQVSVRALEVRSCARKTVRSDATVRSNNAWFSTSIRASPCSARDFPLPLTVSRKVGSAENALRVRGALHPGSENRRNESVCTKQASPTSWSWRKSMPPILPGARPSCGWTRSA
ncbi:MAG: GrpB family protein [Actinomycetota bacterium]